MPSLFYAGQPDYIEKLNTLATAASMTNGTVAASFLSLAVTGTATAASFVGPLTGNASTATTLATARNINGVSFNGSADITVTAAAGTLTGATLAAGVTASSLTSVGTLTALTVSGQSSFAAGSAAAPSVKVGAEQNGLYSSAANTLDVTLNGVRQAQFAYTASAVNYLKIAGAPTGGALWLDARGSDANVSILYSTRGSGSHVFASGNSATNQFVIAHVANAVNYLQAAGNSTGAYPSLRSIGSDTNVGFDFSTQGAAPIRFYTAAFGAEQFRVASVASAVNYLQAAGNTTGNEARLSVQGSDTNAGMWVTTKGNGVIRMETGGGEQFRVSHAASAVNYWQAQGAATTGMPILFATGSDASVSGVYSTKGAGNHAFYTNSTTAPQFFVSHTTSSVNFLQVTGAATGNAVSISTGGSDTNRSITIGAAGTGSVIFQAAGASVMAVGQWSGADKALYILNTTTAPSANPTGGGYLYCEGGALKYRGSAGTVTTIAAA